MQFDVDQVAAERRRLAALHAYDVLDTARETDFDDLAKLAAALCGTAMSAISLVDADRQWFKAELNVGARETPRDIAFCAHALHVAEIMVVPDAALDARFADNPLVTGPPHIRFYAGAVLRTSEGEALGTVCVLDPVPRPQGLTAQQSELLIGVGRQAMAQLELRRALKSERDQRVSRNAADVALAAALEASDSVGAWMWDVKADKVYADARFASFFHVEPEAAAEGIPVADFLAGIEAIDRPRVSSAIELALRAGEPFEEEYRLKPPPGSAEPRWVLARGRALMDDSGKPARFPGAVLDITTRRRSEEAARAASVALQLTLRAARFGRWDHDPSTGARYYDERLRELFGLAPGDDRDFEATLSHVHPQDQDRLRLASLEMLDPDRQGGFAATFRVARPEGGWRWLEASGQSFFEFGRCVRFTGVMQDVTERVDAAAEREEAALRLQLALDAGGVGAWSFNPIDQSITWDERCYALMDAPPGGPVSFGADFIGRLHPQDRERALANVVQAVSGDEYADELRVRLSNGEDRWLAFRGRRSQGEVEFIGTIRDITAEKRVEAQRGLLADELRHRMKNLLAMVQSIGAQTLRNASSKEEAQRLFSERLVALAGALDTLTDRTWASSPLVTVIDAALAPHTDRSDRISVSGPDVELEPKPALALTLALHELATNATKYGALSNSSGRVRLRWSIDGEGEAAALRIEWAEEGGPTVAAPKRRSFGSRLIENNAGQEFGGSAKLVFDPQGVVWTLTAPMKGLSDSSR